MKMANITTSVYLIADTDGIGAKKEDEEDKI